MILIHKILPRWKINNFIFYNLAADDSALSDQIFIATENQPSFCTLRVYIILITTPWLPHSYTHRSLPCSSVDALILYFGLPSHCFISKKNLSHLHLIFLLSICVPVVPAPGCVWIIQCLFPSGSRGQAVCRLRHASRCHPDCLRIETQE